MSFGRNRSESRRSSRLSSRCFSLRSLLAALVAVLGPAAVLAGCGNSGNGGGSDIDCDSSEYWDPANERCIPKMMGDDPDAGPADDTDDAEDSPDTSDTAPPMDDTGTVPEDTAPPQDTGPDPMCDKDGDRALAPSCGGNDCDDQDPTRSPNTPERCDTVDNNCSGENNEGLDCSFYAHEGSKLYKVSPFEKTATKVGENLPNLLDLDTHPDGTLYGITEDGYYKFDEQTGKWDALRKFPRDASYLPQDPNGMAIDRSGTAFITSRDKLWKITYKPEKTGEKKWWVEKVGTTGKTSSGTPLVSSGDCVIKKTSLYMTSKHDEKEDYLVELSKDGGKAANSQMLPLGEKEIFGLTSAWGTLYGLTKGGKLIEINTRTGSTRIVHNFQNRRWYGAASTPRRN